MKSLFDKLPSPFFVLAPMYDVTDTVFRQMVASLSPPDLFFTEFVNADGLQSKGRKNIGFRLRFSDKEKPLIAQIWGKNPENFKKTAADLVQAGFDGIDINMGCPDKAVLKNGCCAALINDHQLAEAIVQATHDGAAGQVPVSVKTRIGFREYDEDWLRFLFGLKLDMLSIHLRTVREMSKVPAHWELMAKIRELRDEIAPNTRLVGNGDVESKAHGLELTSQHKVDGVMIGTGIFRDPFAFSDQSRWEVMGPAEKIKIYERHVKLFAETWTKGERPIITLNKFCKIYVNGFDGAKEYRERLMHASSTDDLLSRLSEIQRELSGI